jgi:hypothetical protein
MNQRVIADPSQHGWVEVDGKWVWDAESGGAGAGMVISETEPTDKVEGMQWLNPTTGLVLFWDDEKWLQMPTTGAAGKDGVDGVDGLWTDNGDDIFYEDGSVNIGRSDSAGAVVGIGGESITASVNNGLYIARDGLTTQYNSEGLHSSASFTVNTGGTSNQAMTIDVGGNTTISAGAGDTLKLEKASGAYLVFTDGTATNASVSARSKQDSGLDALVFAVGPSQTTCMSINDSGRVDITGSLYVNGTPKIGTVDLIKAFSKLRDAVKDEDTVEALKESITNCIGGLIEEWESMQASTQEISDE